MDFPKLVDRISMELPILYFKESQVERIIDGLGLIRLFFGFPELCF